MKRYRVLGLLFLALSLCSWRPLPQQPAAQVIVMGRSSEQAATAIQQVHGSVERYLNIVNGVVANVDQQQIGYLRSQGFSVALNAPLSTAATPAARTTGSNGIYPSTALGIDAERPGRLTGRGVTVAIVNSGLPTIPDLKSNKALDDGSLAAYERDGSFLIYRDFTGPTRRSRDPYGHGTHIAGTIADATPIEERAPKRWRGIAPDANLVVARALGDDGSGTYADAIAAIEWIVSIKDQYQIRVLNLSLFAPVQSLYWADPMNQAVMRAWQSGLVVVVAAGNNGPTAESVAVPGNSPYVITVGAYRSAAVSGSGQDEMTQFSARGPTPDSGFVKPDVMAPGVRVIAGLPRNSALAESAAPGEVLKHTELDLAGTKSHVGLFQLSGTSMAAAEVSGLVALLLEQRPNLTNDQVKWLLSRNARLAVDAQTGKAAYSTWEQGFGRVDAAGLLSYRGEVGAANLRMDIARDLDRENGQHYVGTSAYDQATGLYSIPAAGDSMSTYFNWCGQFVSWPGSVGLGGCGSSGGGTTEPSAGSIWSGAGSIWSGAGSIWSGAGSIWSGAGSIWSGAGSIWSGAGSIWSGAGSIWSGHGSIWSGAGSIWSGAGSIWSGAGSIWSGGVIRSGLTVSWNGDGS